MPLVGVRHVPRRKLLSFGIFFLEVFYSNKSRKNPYLQLFEPFGMVEKVKKINNYSFIHYSKREQGLIFAFNSTISS